MCSASVRLLSHFDESFAVLFVVHFERQVQLKTCIGSRNSAVSMN